MEERFANLLRPYLTFLPEGQDVQPDLRLREMGLNSMKAIELLFDIEDNYHVALPDEQLSDETFETAGSLWQAVSQMRDGVPS